MPAVFRIDAFRTLDESVRSHFRDPRLRQLFNRFATYNGSSPFRAPATLSIIPHVEFRMGGWYVRGGMYAIARALGRLAAKLEIDIQTGVEVTRVISRHGAVKGVETAGGPYFAADVVVMNADARYAQERLIPKRKMRLMKPEQSLGGFVMMLGVRKTYPTLAHHTVLFSGDYRAEFDEMFDFHRPPYEPTIYVAQSCKSEASMAPNGSSNIFILVNAPAVSPDWDWDRQKMTYRGNVLRSLARRGIKIDQHDIEVERIITPKEFETTYNAFRGSIYGTSSNSRWSAFLRVPNRSRELKNLYYAGGSAHPGGGIPLVLLSGKNVADLVLENASRRKAF
jgi:phytoene desaturase